jgi:hypothetical protein
MAASLKVISTLLNLKILFKLIGASEFNMTGLAAQCCGHQINGLAVVKSRA